MLMRRKIALAIALPAAIAATSVVNAGPAHAEYWSGGLPVAQFTVSNYNFNDTWQPGMDQALSNWNNTATPAMITKSSSPKGKIYAQQYADGWYGLYVYSGARDSSRTFTIQLNARTIAAAQKSYGGTFKNWVTAIFVHELGHGLSLKDNPSTSSSTIMKYRTNWSTLTKPTSYDTTDVNKIYRTARAFAQEEDFDA